VIPRCRRTQGRRGISIVQRHCRAGQRGALSADPLTGLCEHPFALEVGEGQAGERYGLFAGLPTEPRCVRRGRLDDDRGRSLGGLRVGERGSSSVQIGPQ